MVEVQLPKGEHESPIELLLCHGQRCTGIQCRNGVFRRLYRWRHSLPLELRLVFDGSLHIGLREGEIHNFRFDIEDVGKDSFFAHDLIWQQTGDAIPLKKGDMVCGILRINPAPRNAGFALHLRLGATNTWQAILLA